MSLAGFEPSVPGKDRPKTLVLELSAAEIGEFYSLPNIIRMINSGKMRWAGKVV
jgi:hypothetical protein